MLAPDSRSPRSGFAYALSAYLAWGIFPLYFKAIRQVPAPEILAHRIVWSAIFLALLVTASGRWREVAAAVRPTRRIGVYALSTALVSTNWLLYIWAVTTGRVLEASLGYFINPLVNVLLGVLLLREHLQKRQAAALLLAAAGVLVLVARLGTIPWLALALAFSFGGYALVRKKARIDPVVGLLIETLLLAPAAAALIVLRGLEHTGFLGSDARTTTLLLLAGVITAVPLIWFAHGVRTLRLSTMGLIQYVSPTLQFLCAVAVFHEPFTRAHAIAFSCIWLGLVLYSTQAFRRPTEVAPLD